MNCWSEIDKLKSQHEQDSKNVASAAKAYGFIGISCSSYGVWTAKSRQRQKHEVELKASSADGLIKQMQTACDAAIKRTR